jgi:hypothetical protein
MMRVCLPFALAFVVAGTCTASAQTSADEPHMIVLRDTVREAVRHAREASRAASRDAARLVRELVRDSHLPPWGADAGVLGLQPDTSDPCERRGGWGDRERHCEVREERLGVFAGPLTVDASPNGGIRVEAWDQNEILIRAIVNTEARTEADARSIASEVQIHTGGGRVHATGPDRSGRRESWHVSYRVYVPARTDLDLSSRNGGISIAGVSGRIRFETRNGGVSLADLAGDVRGRTANGGLHVTLGGARWDGDGLDVETTNGGVRLSVPDGYSAELTASTVNGGFRSEVPITVQGRIDRAVSGTMGSGGAPVKVRTTNGGVRVTRR